MDTLRLILQYACAAGFGLLTIRQFRTRSVYLVRAFTALCLLITINSALWATSWRTTQFYLLEPLLLALQFAAVVELVASVIPKMPAEEGQGLLITLSGLGLAGAFLASLMYPEIRTQMQIYKTIRFSVHTGLLISSIAGSAYFFLKPSRFTRAEKCHASILLLYLLKFVVLESARGIRADEDLTYEVISAVSMSWSLVCCLLWLLVPQMSKGPEILRASDSDSSVNSWIRAAGSKQLSSR